MLGQDIVIGEIADGTNYYVEVEDDERVPVVVAGRDGRKYLRTDPDKTVENTLLSLPQLLLNGVGPTWPTNCDHGLLDFTVPPLAEYLRENHPIGSFDERATNEWTRSRCCSRAGRRGGVARARWRDLVGKVAAGP
jgi:Protein of unknown function (DUF3892)